MRDQRHSDKMVESSAHGGLFCYECGEQDLLCWGCGRCEDCCDCVKGFQGTEDDEDDDDDATEIG
jgi:hypothetical protein